MGKSGLDKSIHLLVPRIRGFRTAFEQVACVVIECWGKVVACWVRTACRRYGAGFEAVSVVLFACDRASTLPFVASRKRHHVHARACFARHRLSQFDRPTDRRVTPIFSSLQTKLSPRGTSSRPDAVGIRSHRRRRIDASTWFDEFVVSPTSLCAILSGPVKRRRALPGGNPPRNSWVRTEESPAERPDSGRGVPFAPSAATERDFLLSGHALENPSGVRGTPPGKHCL